MVNAKDIGTEIMTFLNARDIPVAGMAGASQLPSVPDDFSPSKILNSARTVVCYGVPIPRGIVYASDHSLALYWRYCNTAYRTLDSSSNRLCLLLEELGYVASPIYGCFPWKSTGREFWGLLPLVYWAEQTGLGRLTKCGLLANPIYGTRILFGGVVTSVELQPTGKMTRDPCPSGCVECAAACPVGAIDKTGKVNHNSCIRHSGANPLLAHLLEDPAVRQKFSFETCLNTVGVDDHASYTCNECLKACPLNK